MHRAVSRVPAAAASPCPEGRIAWLDFLRGAAAFAVVLFHVRVNLWIGWRAVMADDSWFDRAVAWITLPFPFFGTAVMLFFVVSGFAIHYPYAAAAGAHFALRPYALRRFFRIYPAYLAAILLTMAAEYAAAGAARMSPSPVAKVGATAAMAQNYVEPTGQMVGNPSLWSLPVEVELYLAYPILFWLWRRVGTFRMFGCVAFISGAAAVALWAGYEWPMGNFAKYWIIWTSGALLAEWTRARTLPKWRQSYWLLVCGGLVVAVWARVAGLPYGFEHFLWGAIYFLIILWGLNHPAPLGWFPAPVVRAGTFLGTISYSLYLIHFPLFLILGAWWSAAFGQKPANAFIPLVASVAVVPIAYLLWRVVELPSQTCGRTLSRLSMPTISVSEVAIG